MTVTKLTTVLVPARNAASRAEGESSTPSAWASGGLTRAEVKAATEEAVGAVVVIVLREELRF